MEHEPMENKRLSYLLEQYRANLCTREELEELFLLVRDGDEGQLTAGLQEQWERARVEGAAAATDWDVLFRQMMDEAGELDEERAVVRNRMRIRRRRRWLVAATGLFFLIGGGAIVRSMHHPRPRLVRAAPAVRRFKNDVQPGGNKAILTLADGSSIELDSANNGTLSVQGNTKILKLASGSLAYQQNRHGAAAVQGPVYNTISTPRGGQYQVVLPDGSKVWLDAGSSLRFPTSFSSGLREVQLSGEAYFDVAADVRKPFRVSVFPGEPGKGDALQHVEVLGTQFNIMAYADEASVKTTLLEGAVRVGASAGNPMRLAPGDQSQLDRSPSLGLTMVRDADVDAAVAWKNGYFNFNKANIETIMRQLSRWYDVDVSFRGNGSRDRLFYGGIQRNLPLSAVFDILERSGVLFSIDGKKVVVNL